MTLATVHSRATAGIQAPPVRVEVNLGGGLPQFHIVGLPDAAVRESRHRVTAAIRNAGYLWPAGCITVNLAPADLPKDGGRFDLPISVGVLAASAQLPTEPLSAFEFLGELSLGGEVRPLGGALSAAIAARRARRTLVLPAASAAEALLVQDVRVVAVKHLLDLPAYLGGDGVPALGREPPASEAGDGGGDGDGDLSDVKGQDFAKRALEIAAAGGHNLLMLGPPGGGKTMLATRLAGLAPSLSREEALETAAVYSCSHHGFAPCNWGRRPFRAPHHTTSAVALVGGGSTPRPGEISLAHNGVLFMDELPEFQRPVLESLREPLEAGVINISRAARQSRFPCRFQLVAAMNPCPCGYLGDPRGRCRCTAGQVQRYRARISGPFLDRIDMHVVMSRSPRPLLRSDGAAGRGETSAVVRARVEAAHRRQRHRQGVINSRLTPRETERICRLDEAARPLLERATEKLALSPRACHHLLRLARTIADLGDVEAAVLDGEHLSEALQLRHLDRAAPEWLGN